MLEFMETPSYVAAKQAQCIQNEVKKDMLFYII